MSQPSDRRATAYGVVSASDDLAWPVGGALLDVLYGQAWEVLTVVVIVLRIVAFVFLSLTRRSRVTH